MKKYGKKFMVLALTGAMTLGMATTALAADPVAQTKDTSSSYTTAGDSISETTDSINLIKDYDRAANTQTDSVSPAEDFSITIKPYAVWNAGTVDGTQNGAAYTTANMPLLGTDITGKVAVNNTNRVTTVTIHANDGDAKDEAAANLSQAVTIPAYSSVGDFWYEVEEAATAVTTGVTYTTNDAATIDHKYYIHVQVVNDGNGGFYKSVTLHQTAPAANLTNAEYSNAAATYYAAGNKVNDIQNTYAAGSVAITKSVTGNAGDKDKRFAVTVTFTKAAGTILNSEITYTAAASATATTAAALTINGQDETAPDWMTSKGGTDALASDSTAAGYAQVTIWVKDNETVTFKNIPYGVTYTVEEANYTNTATDAADKLGYDAADYTFSDTDKTIDSAADTVTIVNNKDNAIDIGVITSDAPYLAMLLLAVLGIFVYLRRRNHIDAL